MRGAYLYLRVSTAEQVENFSLDTQERACREYCEREGLDIVRIFREEGESAKSADRTQLQAMLNACVTDRRREGIVAVVVFRVDRLARKVEDYAGITGALDKLGIRVHSAGEAFDSSPAGRLVENLLAAVAQFDNDARSARTIAGMQEALRRGRWVWKPPFGYRRPPVDSPVSMVVNREVGPLIRHGFEAIGSGRLTKPEALRELTDLGLVTERGRPLSPQVFGGLLRKVTYTGRIVKPEWGIDVAGDFEAIVEPEVFEAAQAVLEGRTLGKAPRVLDNPDFPLRRVVRCGRCSTPLTGSWSTGRANRRYPYYRCSQSSCRGTNIRKERLEGLLMERLDAMSVRPEMLDLLGAVVEEAWTDRSQTSRATEATFNSRLRDIERRLAALTDAWLDGRGIDDATYERQRQRLNDDATEMRNRLATARAPEINLTRAIDLAQTMLADLPGCWDRLEPQQRPDFLTAIYPAGLTYDGVEIGTVENSWWLASPALSGASMDTQEALVPPSGFEPPLPP